MEHYDFVLYFIFDCNHVNSNKAAGSVNTDITVRVCLCFYTRGNIMCSVCQRKTSCRDFEELLQREEVWTNTDSSFHFHVFITTTRPSGKSAADKNVDFVWVDVLL